MSQSATPISTSIVDRTLVAPDTTDSIPAAIQASQQAFIRDLPELLTSHYRQWVAYCGSQKIGIGRSKSDLYEQCLQQGLRRSDFVVRSIEPVASDDVDALSDV